MWGWVILVGVVLAAVAGQLWKVHSRKQPVEPITEVPDLRQATAHIDAVADRSITLAAEVEGRRHAP